MSSSTTEEKSVSLNLLSEEDLKKLDSLNCAHFPKPKINVQDNFTVLGPFQTKSGDELDRLWQGQNGIPLVAKHKVMGVTWLTTSADHNITYRINPIDGQDSSCVSIDQITLNVSALNEVYAHPEYPSGSCRYQDTVEHENRHVESNRKVYQKYRKIFAAKLDSSFILLGNQLTPNYKLEGYKSSLDQKLISEMKPLVVEMDNEMNKENSKIDSRAEFIRSSKACGGI